jgi:thioredoxin-like negative regulator of GroEL
MDKILGFPMWVWLVATIVLYVTYFSKENFADTQDEIKIYNFNTEWCGWSKRFQPEWDEFSKNVSGRVKAIDVKCDNDKNQQLCKEFEVPGFPSVIAMVNGKRHEYRGERTAKALKEFAANLK